MEHQYAVSGKVGMEDNDKKLSKLVLLLAPSSVEGACRVMCSLSTAFSELRWRLIVASSLGQMTEARQSGVDYRGAAARGLDAKLDDGRWQCCSLFHKSTGVRPHPSLPLPPRLR
jgi:hypothetical protein